jgi:hypothetical protein
MAEEDLLFYLKDKRNTVEELLELAVIGVVAGVVLIIKFTRIK